MLKRILLAALLLTNGCSSFAVPVEVQENPKVQEALANHQAILAAISDYVAKLQEQGILPKPESLEKKPE